MPQHRHGIDGGARRFLHRATPEGFQRRLRGDHQHRDIVLVGTGDTGDGIGRARTRSGAAHAEQARVAGVAVGHEGGTRLVARDDGRDAAASFAAGERIVEGFDGTTGDAEHVFDADLFQVGNDEVGSLWIDDREQLRKRILYIKRSLHGLSPAFISVAFPEQGSH